ncbi:PKD domain-containing protein, partial [Streptomyces chumphonensis]
TVRAGRPPAGEEPTASFTVFCMQDVCDFDARRSSDPDGDIAAYAWDFGDGTGGSGATVSHRYPAAQQNYTVRLTVTDTAGHTGTATRTLQCWNLGTSAFCFPR